MSKFIALVTICLLLTACSENGYRIEGNNVVYKIPWNAGHGSVVKTLNADSATFEVLGDDNMNWAKDKSKVFWGYIYLDFMDSKTFEVLSIAFAKDKYYVICGEDIIKETNPKEFKLRTYTEKGKEKIYGVDNNAAYICSEVPNGYLRLSSSSIKDFRALGNNYFTDSNKISWGSHLLKDVNVANFKVLKGGYATDEEHIFYTDDIVKGADVLTFEVIEDDYGQDKNFKYYLNDRINGQ